MTWWSATSWAMYRSLRWVLNCYYSSSRLVRKARAWSWRPIRILGNGCDSAETRRWQSPCSIGSPPERMIGKYTHSSSRGVKQKTKDTGSPEPHTGSLSNWAHWLKHSWHKQVEGITSLKAYLMAQLDDTQEDRGAEIIKVRIQRVWEMKWRIQWQILRRRQ